MCHVLKGNKNNQYSKMNILFSLLRNWSSEQRFNMKVQIKGKKENDLFIILPCTSEKEEQSWDEPLLSPADSKYVQNMESVIYFYYWSAWYILEKKKYSMPTYDTLPSN